MTRRQGVAALVFIAIVWGCSFTIIKQTLALASPFVLLALRFLLASLLVAPWFRGLSRRESTRSGSLVTASPIPASIAAEPATNRRCMNAASSGGSGTWSGSLAARASLAA